MAGPETVALAAQAHALLLGRAATVATAESLTGGLIGAAITCVPGVSATFRGGVVSYATDAKRDVLGVPGELLAEHGAVHPDVALAMAKGVRRVLWATFGLAVTGVAGPDSQDGRPPGTVFAAVAGPGHWSTVVELRLTGDRGEIREKTVDQALSLLLCSVAKTTLK
ncbi:CinA family protein [Nocardiopsis ansamitocini]|uniref:Competence damage-inducible protein A n=1 Tax=Nocardiopsis ansamitocini TaxID=1670832 RepID=A0A9W6P3D6_9ACTN|nr:CinA family protein [Nocardiopsis ansamitocini]GLU46421.1 competence damage-inducible protein A [Nocardiopsis ansamitocini]